MCEPTTILAVGGFVANGIGAVADYASQSSAANQNEQAANADAALQEKALSQQTSLRMMQEQQASQQSIFQADLAARRADAQARVMAGESGVAGASVDMVLQDIERQRLMNKQTTEKNLGMTVEQLEQQRIAGRQNIESTRQNRINSVPQPNPFATALQIGTSGLDAANTYYKNQPRVGQGG